MKKRTVPCPRCDGSGHDPKARPTTTTDRCPRCKGQGIIEVTS